jgi:hypothetical protein
MKLYTIQEVINAYFNGLRDGRSNFSDLDICLNSLTPIELPSDDYRKVHLRHCYQGEYEDCCKYSEDDCPAKPLETPKQQDNGK